jgi:uncharacterized membrane protein YedE/YeeE
MKIKRIGKIILCIGLICLALGAVLMMVAPDPWPLICFGVSILLNVVGINLILAARR